jgi:hypothetical protein
MAVIFLQASLPATLFVKAIDKGGLVVPLLFTPFMNLPFNGI